MEYTIINAVSSRFYSENNFKIHPGLFERAEIHTQPPKGGLAKNEYP